MKATGRTFAQIAPRAAREARIFFFCGPDEAGASAAAAKLAAMLPDPGERVELSGADLRRDPVALTDEARSVSLFGDTRHLWVRATGDEASAALETLAEGIDALGHEPCPVIVVATAATDKSRSAKLLEGRGDALVAMFWPPELPDVVGEVRRMADAAGLRLTAELATRIARGAGLDLRLAGSEIAKLALYCDAAPEAPQSLDAEALEAVGAATEEDGFQPLVDAVLSGRLAALPDELRRMRETGMNAVGLCLALERRAVQIVQLAGRLGQGGNAAQLVESERRARRLFGDTKMLADQLGRWQGARAGRLIERLAALHAQLLGNSQTADLLLAHHLAAIAREAARG